MNAIPCDAPTGSRSPVLASGRKKAPTGESSAMLSDRSHRAVSTALIICAALVAGCTSGPKIITNSAPGFDLGAYQTFGYFEPLGTDRDSVRSLNSQVLIAATTRQLEMRGLTRDDTNPDLLVNFLGATKETLETRPSAGPNMYYGRGRYGTWGGYGMSVGTSTEVVQRTQGTLSVDLVDPKRNELVWEGAATARITDDMRENRSTVLEAAIRDIFAQFP